MPPGSRSALGPLVLATAVGATAGYLALPRVGVNAERVVASSLLPAAATAPEDEAAPHPARAAEPASGGADDAGAPAEEAGDDESPVEARNREAVRRAEAGDAQGAAALLREAHALEPGNDLVRRNLQAVLINAGFAAIAAERFDAAVSAFAEALPLGDRAEVRRGLGYAYYRLDRHDLAVTNLERALALEGGDAETYLTLGRIYLERHDHPRALPMLERALAAGASAPGLEDTIARLRRDADAEEGFHELASSHFVIKFDGREQTEAGRLVLNALEDAYRRVGARFAYYPLERQEVVLYPDETFREITNSPHWSGGVYDGRIKLPIGGLARGNERLQRTVRHEYAHAAIVTLSRGRAPVWLNEGLAQVAEDVPDEGRTNRLRLAIADRSLIALPALESGFTRFDRQQASLAYSQAWFAARYLLEKKGGYNVRRLLEAMATADDTDAAFRQALGLTYAEFEQRLVRELERHG